MRSALQLHLSRGENRHSRAEISNIFNDVSRQYHHHVFAHFRQKIQETVALFGVEPRGWLVGDNEVRIADQACAIPKR